MIAPNLVGNPHHLHHLTNRVDSHDMRPGKDRTGRCCRGRPVAVDCRHRDSKRFCEKRLSGGTDEQWPSELGELIEARKRFVAVRRILREAKPGVEDDTTLGNSGAGGCSLSAEAGWSQFA